MVPSLRSNPIQFVHTFLFMWTAAIQFDLLFPLLNVLLFVCFIKRFRIIPQCTFICIFYQKISNYLSGHNWLGKLSPLEDIPPWTTFWETAGMFRIEDWRQRIEDWRPRIEPLWGGTKNGTSGARIKNLRLWNEDWRLRIEDWGLSFFF